MTELYGLLGALPQITGPLSLIAFMGIIFYLLYRRSVNTGRGLEFAYEYMKSISPQLRKQDFFRIILLFFLLILVLLFLVFLFLLELKDVSLYLYLGLFVLIFLSFLFFAYKLSSNKDRSASARKKGNDMQKLDSTKGNIESLLKQKASLEKSLTHLDEKSAKFGMDVPLNLINEIDDVKERLQAVIAAIKTQQV